MDERVTLLFHGLMLERFLERALAEGVLFSSVRRLKGHEARLVTDERGADKLVALAERFALDVRVVERAGAGQIRKRLLRRLTLPLALIAVGALMLSFFSRVWIVEVRLLDGARDAAPLRSALARLGVEPGLRAGDIDPIRLALNAQALAPEFSYVSARVQGVRLLVEATRSLPAPDLYDPEAARDLVAARDALLEKVDVLAGSAAVKPGDVVKRGQVLIRGEERDGRETTRGVCALGAVLGRVWLTGEAEASLTRAEVIDTPERRTESELRLLTWSVPLKRVQPYELERVEREQLPVGGLFLPLKIVRDTHIRQQSRAIAADEAQIKEEISKIALDRALSKLPEGVEPVDKWIDYSMIEGESISARAVVEILVNVAVSRDAISADNGGN